MNKHMFIEELSKRCELSINDATIVNSILEDNFFLSKSSKDSIVNGIMNALNIDIDTSTSIYEECVIIARSAVKDKLKHPFRNANRK